ncbi:hypothetical protein RND71_005708 [Anisodus tanguticus]|uniref:Uncharacterized protein n=1 Tax=Anisodus tanguticus TaxID=243964 RepID=A0AAE1SSQ6_9SOLA|nr:hypothetical protein RND71_005708 [Anisodus tanguticus]
MMKISKGQHRINSIVLQQSVGTKMLNFSTFAACQYTPNSLGTEHLEIIDMNCSSNQVESAILKRADRHFEETSGGDQSCHDSTTPLTHAARPTKQAAVVRDKSTIPREHTYFLLSGFPVDELERTAKAPKELRSQNSGERVEPQALFLRKIVICLNSLAETIDNTDVYGKDDFLHGGVCLGHARCNTQTSTKYDL